MIAEMVLFDPPVPITAETEAVVTINRWLHLADEITDCVDPRPVEDATGGLEATWLVTNARGNREPRAF
jgi:hypothetical protein